MNLEEVARHAGVSRSTVSRVLNNGPGVSEETRAAVRAVADALGYVPNASARSLASRAHRPETVAIAITGDHPHLTAILRGAAAGLRDLRIVVLIDPEDLDRTADAAIVLGSHPHPTTIPSVHIGRPLTDPTVPYVAPDNLTGGLLAGRHLIARGTTNVAALLTSPDTSPTVDRLTGLRRALDEIGRTPVAQIPCTPETVDAELATLTGFDAVFCTTDTLAVPALRHTRTLITFDDTGLATATTPRLTTIQHRPEDLGATAAWHLKAQLAGEPHLPLAITLPMEVVARDT
ncbi:LacI family DNA-binding transcriptional regulator [Actinokineospora auranticolor]|uniref:LacI family transcriptional regulator n=1 Tax=Actinokineospora auranticolor TaxID=155976 RepID=A0A2S6GJQ4_9PSEU|nr:LacI family DNA-binding transcriptional regulator [Actinokineospora auranticolor]PPK65381.1 LacI family transcriptional regulator [Actinokineospora auranticolor]